VKNSGNLFIPSFISSNILLAVTAPYLVILLRDIGYTTLWVGILFSIFEAAGLAGPFILGYLSDKTGNYRLSLLLSCILPAVVIFPLILWVNPLISIISLFFMAFGLRSLVSLIDAITTVQIGASGNYGRLRVWGSISFIVMTMFFQWTPFLKPDSSLNIGIWLFALSILCLIPTLILPKHSLRLTAEFSNTDTADKPVAAVKGYVFCGFSIIFLSRFGMAAIVTYFSLFMIETVKWDAVGLMWALAAVAEVPFLFLSKKLIRRFGSMSLLAMSAFGVCLRLLLLAFFPFKVWIIISTLLHSLCFGIYHPAAIQFVSSLYPAEKRGRGMSMYMIMGTGLPAITGAFAGGTIIQAFGYKPMFLVYAGISALAVLIYSTLFLRPQIRGQWRADFPVN
jgi:PPP family 3-phenylpropionic acid transporter